MPGGPKSYREALPVLVAVAIASFMVQLDTSIVNIALPTITEEMSSTTSVVARIVLFYMLAIVSTLLLFGRIGDHIGKKPVFVWGYVVFTVASMLCGIAGSLDMLIAMRVLQGLGGAMLFATTSAIVIANIPREHHGRAFGLVAVFSGIGVAVGAPLGGLLVGTIGWRWVFFINALPGLCGILLSQRRLENDGGTASGEREGLDLPGVVLSSVSIFTLVMAFNSGSERGWTSPHIIILLSASALSMVLFVLREKRIPKPLLDLGIFRTRLLTGGLITKLTTVAIMNGSLILFPYFLQKVMGVTTMHTGLLMGVFPIMVLVASPIAGILTDRMGSGRISGFGAMLTLCATVMLVVFRYTESVPLLIGAFMILGFGIGLFFPANMKLVMGHAIRGREGTLSAVNSLASFLGGAIGIAVLETVFSLGFPSVHDYQNLPAGAVSSGFGHAMYASVALAAVTVVYSIWLLGKGAPPPEAGRDGVQELI